MKTLVTTLMLLGIALNMNAQYSNIYTMTLDATLKSPFEDGEDLRDDIMEKLLAGKYTTRDASGNELTIGTIKKMFTRTDTLTVFDTNTKNETQTIAEWEITPQDISAITFTMLYEVVDGKMTATVQYFKPLMTNNKGQNTRYKIKNPPTMSTNGITLYGSHTVHPDNINNLASYEHKYFVSKENVPSKKESLNKAGQDIATSSLTINDINSIELELEFNYDGQTGGWQAKVLNATPNLKTKEIQVRECYKVTFGDQVLDYQFLEVSKVKSLLTNTKPTLINSCNPTEMHDLSSFTIVIVPVGEDAILLEENEQMSPTIAKHIKPGTRIFFENIVAENKGGIVIKHGGYNLQCY